MHQVISLGRVPSQVSSFAETLAGELLATCFDGKVYRMVAAKKDG